jgi:hypothetical protein
VQQQQQQPAQQEKQQQQQQQQQPSQQQQQQQQQPQQQSVSQVAATASRQQQSHQQHQRLSAADTNVAGEQFSFSGPLGSDVPQQSNVQMGASLRGMPQQTAATFQREQQQLQHQQAPALTSVLEQQANANRDLVRTLNSTMEQLSSVPLHNAAHRGRRASAAPDDLCAACVLYR